MAYNWISLSVFFNCIFLLKLRFYRKYGRNLNSFDALFFSLHVILSTVENTKKVGKLCQSPTDKIRNLKFVQKSRFN